MAATQLRPVPGGPDEPQHPGLPDPIALAPAMVEAVRLTRAFAPAATPVVLYGDSGTGKTFLAEYMHQLSGREGGFHPFSVGQFSPQLAMDELFGHVPGAFTDARKARPGCLVTAGTGTLLLDDVQNLDLGVQKQLLQVLDRGTYRQMGSDRVYAVVCRIIFAMTDHPDGLMRRGVLVEDFRYRFGECRVGTVPLAERRIEIPVYVAQALERARVRSKVRGPRRMSAAAMALLQEADYPGNLRQLHGVVERAYVVAAYEHAEEIRVEDFDGEFRDALRYERRGDRAARRGAVERALERTGGNVAAAARLLGVHRNTVRAAVAEGGVSIIKQPRQRKGVEGGRGRAT